MNAAQAGQIKGMYIMGENPAMSDPDLAHAREALASLRHLVVQDLFLTETAFMADVVLPASAFPERPGPSPTPTGRCNSGGAGPGGRARQDWWIIQEIARRLGLDWNYTHPRDVFNEMRQVMPSIAEISWQGWSGKAPSPILATARINPVGKSCSAKASRCRAAEQRSSRPT